MRCSFPSPSHPTARPTCYECFRPKSSCYCPAIVPIDNRTRVVILQHPREHFHPLNTARIAARSLSRCELLSVPVKRMTEALQRARPADEAALLFPDQDAVDLAELPLRHRPREVIVLDGTWHHARTLLRDLPILESYRRIRLRPPSPSAYRIRKEPHADFVSTIECIAHLLSHLEPDTPHLTRLLDAFHFMIDRNLALRPSITGEEARVSRKRARLHRFPPLLEPRRKRFCVVYAEGTSWFPKNQRTTSKSESQVETRSFPPKEPLVVCFQEMNELEVFPPRRVLIRTRARPPAHHLEHLAISEEILSNEALDPSSAARFLQRELPQDTVLIVCNASSYRIVREAGLSARPHLELKGIYCDWQRYLAGRGRDQASAEPFEEQRAPLPWEGIEGTVERHGIPCSPTPKAGRADRRLAQSVALYTWLVEQRRLHLRGFL